MFTNEFSEEVWTTTYKDHKDNNASDMMRRVAKTMAAGEATEELKKYWEELFFQYLDSFKITVGGRTYSNAGTEWNGTTFINCFVGKTAEYDCDSLDGILKVLRDQAQTLKSEGGWGMNFSFIRPRGSFIHGVGVETPGAVKYMEMFDKSSEIVTSGSGKESNNSKAKGKIRKGAQMAVLNCISGDTYIDTLEGKIKIRELVGKNPYLYCTDGNGKVYVRKALAVFSSGVKKTIKVTFDNGDFIECTPDHRFMLSDGTFKEAKNLIMTDSLAALNKRFLGNYLYISVAGSKINIAEHNAVFEMKYGYYPSALTSEKRTGDMTVAHHIDYSTVNNHPDNLIEMTVADHSKEHGEVLAEHQKRISEERKGKTWEEYYGAEKAAGIKEKCVNKRKGGIPWNKGLTGDLYKEHYESGFSNQFVENSNHKVLRIEESIEQEVFDVSMPDHHNFSANGIFIHNCWHPDIIEFITAKQTPGRLTKFNVSVGFSDDFMTRLDRITHIEKLLSKENDDVKAEKLRDTIDALDVWELQFPLTTFEKYKAEWDGDLQVWKKKGYPVNTHGYTSVRTMWNLVMESTYNRADPGVLFLDRANYFNPLNYLEKIHSTNPCVIGETEVLTKDGYKRIDSLVGSKVEIWNGFEWSEVEPKVTGENQEILDIEFSNGSKLSCTPYHGFFLKDGSRVEARDLSSGDKLQKFIFPLIDGGITLEEAYTHGFYSGDGSVNRNEIWLYGNKCQLLPYFPIKSVTDQSTSTIERKAIVLNLPKENLNKEFVPDASYSVLSRLSWLAGLMDSDGTVLKDGSIQITSINKLFLSNVLKMLNTLGVRGVIALNKSAEIKLMPNGRGGESLYQCQDCYRLSISGTNVCNLISIGLYSNRLDLSYIPSREATRSIKVVKKTERPNTERYVYCFNEPKRHTAIFNGVMTGQCGEQVLAPGGCCNLGSINLTQFVNATGFDFDALKNATRVLVRLLDNVNTISSAPLPEYVDSMRNKRRVGVGIMGWGSLLYMMNTRFGSEDANVLREEIMSTIARTAYMYSIDLAEEKGMFSYCDPAKHADAAFVRLLGLSDEYITKLKKFGIRNSSLLSIQPTGNTGILANVVSGGCEPIFLPEYVRTVILNTPPAHLLSVMPKYWEGEFGETDMFKFTKEGEDELLRGVDKDGTVYKIDKNRGLTKEVLCEDYGVWWLKQRGEWDPEADWAVSTNDLQVQDHLNDLSGFARWVDSAISKTVNVPNDYPFDKFKDIYLEAYRTGYVKGVTTYRAGTMMSVLSAKDEKSASLQDEEIIAEDVKLPESAPAMVKTLKVEGKKWYLTVVMNESNNRPFALFVTTNVHEPNVTTFDVTERLLSLAAEKGIPKKHIDEIELKIKRDSNHAKMARVISLLLRHGVFIREIVRVLDSVENAFVGSFLFQIKKFLSTFIRDGEKAVGEKCTECGSTNVIFSEGCRKCANCGSSKCG